MSTIRRSDILRQLLLLAISILIPTSALVAQEQGPAVRSAAMEAEVLALFDQIVATEVEEYGAGRRLEVDLNSFVMTARSLLGRPVPEDVVRSAIGRGFIDVFWQDALAQSSTSDTSRALHIRLDGVAIRGSFYTVLTTATYRQGDEVDMAGSLTIFAHRGGSWERLRRINLGLT